MISVITRLWVIMIFTLEYWSKYLVIPYEEFDNTWVITSGLHDLYVRINYTVCIIHINYEPVCSSS